MDSWQWRSHGGGGARGARAHLIPLRPLVGFVQNRRVFLSGGGGVGVEVVMKSSKSRRYFLERIINRLVDLIKKYNNAVADLGGATGGHGPLQTV